MSTSAEARCGETATAETLNGLRVLEIGHYVAAPFCTRLLADLGAEVIKIEPLTGDPVRGWGPQVRGRSLWWSIHGRNKRSIAMDLKSEQAKSIVLALAAKCDVVVENFRPGQLERLGLGPVELRRHRPDLIIARISGFGQTGPNFSKAAFGVIGEAMGGLRHLTNHPPGASELPPVRVGVSIGDSISGLYAAFGIMAALWQRDRQGGDAAPRTLDVALTESVLSLMEGMLPEYGALGTVRQPTGGGITTAAPSNAYPTADGSWILIAANSNPLFKKLTELLDRPNLSNDPRFADNTARVTHSGELDEMLGAWTRTLPIDRLVDLLSKADIPATKVYTAEDIAADPQFRARGMVQEVEDPALGLVLHSGIVPYVPESPGRIRWTGPEIGQDGPDILRNVLGYGEEAIAVLREEGVVG